MNEITINWHIIQKCNYECYYCFANYKKTITKEIAHSKTQIEIVLKKLYSFFQSKFKANSIRLNIAGGEPTLSKNINFIIQKAFNIGFKVSIITNGSLINNKFISQNAKYLYLYGISLDSLNKETNQIIGRENEKNILKISQVLRQIEKLRELNPQIKIKLNTVVNKYNYQEEIYLLVNIIKPYKWKILQALAINSTEVYCTNQEFKIFLEINKKSREYISEENNKQMTESYIMIDPFGRFYQNTESKYFYTESILLNNIQKEFSKLNFDLKKYLERY